MSRLLILMPVLVLVPLGRLAAAEAPVREAPKVVSPTTTSVGRMIPDLTSKDIDGKAFQLSEFAKSRKATVIALTSTSCPISKKYLPTLAKLEKEYAGKNIGFLFLNPIASEKPEDAQKAVRAAGIVGPYLLDADNSLARAIGARSTADVFLLDAKRTVIYHGAIDDQYGLGYSQEAPKQSFLADALAAVVAGSPVKVQATTAPGCELDLSKAKVLEVAVTYHNRISRIIQKHCWECHRQGGVAPFSLATHDDVVAHKGMIKKVVDRGTMPPWFAATGGDHPKFENDRSLPTADKSDLLAWLAGGTPVGDAADAPLPPWIPGEWTIGKPDVIFQIPKPIPIKATGTMPYQTAFVETHFEEDRWVKGFEIQPTDKSVVHHVLVFAMNNDPKLTPAQRAKANSDESQGFFAAYVPGNSSQVLPEGFAKKLPRGSKLRFQLHYTPSGTATKEQVRLGLIFAPEPPKHEVKVYGLVNYKIRIPPGAEDHAEKAELRLPLDVVVVGFLPHLHVRGKACRYEATTPEGKKVPLLDIPHYDFNWQLRYQFAEPIRLSRGSTLGFYATFDNSAKNPANPDPKQTVRWGPQTTDEMHLGYVEFYVPTK